MNRKDTTRIHPRRGIILLALIGLCAYATTPTPRTFDGSRGYQHVLAQMNFGPRPVGSLANEATANYIAGQLRDTGWVPEFQAFDFRGARVRNVLARKGRGVLVILGTHFDTRQRADQDPNPAAPVPGANDGASGVAVLLELARVLDDARLKNTVELAFFDAEDDGNLDGWPWSVGAQYTAEHLTEKPEAVIVVDLIGDADQNIYFERNSDAALQQELWTIAEKLGYTRQFIREFKHSLTDDHTPFLQRGIRAVDIIDFDYPYWHTTQDTTDKVSADSLERVGRVLEVWIEGE